MTCPVCNSELHKKNNLGHLETYVCSSSRINSSKYISNCHYSFYFNSMNNKKHSIFFEDKSISNSTIVLELHSENKSQLTLFDNGTYILPFEFNDFSFEELIFKIKDYLLFK